MMALTISMGQQANNKLFNADRRQIFFTPVLPRANDRNIEMRFFPKQHIKDNSILESTMILPFCQSFLNPILPSTGLNQPHQT